MRLRSGLGEALAGHPVGFSVLVPVYPALVRDHGFELEHETAADRPALVGGPIAVSQLMTEEAKDVRTE
jgi:hypothetical protein